MPQLDLAIWLLTAFALLGAVDAIYLHLWRFALHTRPESRFEHLTHTTRAFLFPAIVALVFTGDFRGGALWVGASVVALDQAVELADALSEHSSRKQIGGLDRLEYVLHGILISLRIAALTLAFSAIPSGAWSLDATTGATVGTAARLVAWNLVPGAILLALLHAALAARPVRLQMVLARLCPSCCTCA